MHEQFWCKHCQTEFWMRIPNLFNGDAFVKCPTCGWKHPRNFVDGVAVSCNLPRSHYTIFERVER